MANSSQKRVCVIGGGVSGLVAIKELLAEGHVPVCFEAAASFGGVFATDGVESRRVYENLRLTIANTYMAFSDFPPQDTYRYWSAMEYYEYIQAYVAKFDLLRHIHYNVKVVAVERVSADRWKVTCSDGTTNLYDGVAICCGTHQAGRNLSKLFPGLETFQGEVSHSSTYVDATSFRGKRVVVIGMGESAADIVRDISNVSQSCDLLLKSFPYSIRRLTGKGIPADAGTTRMRYPSSDDTVFTWVVCLCFLVCYWPFYLLGLSSWWDDYPANDPSVTPMKNGAVVDGMGQSPKGGYYDFQCPRDPRIGQLLASWHAQGNITYLNKFATKNVSWLPNVVNEKIQVTFDTIGGFTQHGIILQKSGRSIAVDHIVFCVGYVDEFPFIIDPQLRPANNDVRSLWKHAFHPMAGPTLAYIGFSRPTTGAIPACSELVARAFAQLIGNKVALPDKPTMQRLIKAEADRENAMFCHSLAVRTVVNPPEYMDSLARLIGCYTPSYKLMLQPIFYLRWLTALSLPARYRLVGPGACPAVARASINKALGGDSFHMSLLLVCKKLFYIMGIGSYDVILDMRKLGWEMTGWV